MADKREIEFKVQAEAVIGTLMGLLEESEAQGLDHVPFDMVYALLFNLQGLSITEFNQTVSEYEERKET